MSLTQLGRYKITGTLGRGAMGIVYQAHDPLIEREVAIKAISCAGLTREESEEFEQRFFREAKSAGRLNHPNIVTIHDVGRSGDLSYIAMEFLVGRSLRDSLDAHVSLPVARIVQIAAEIADGLAFAHANGIVHRDIKPSNIMVLDSGAVKITDFGIAQLPSSSLTLVGTAMGTPKYMAPEQINGRKADGRSDIFSLGAVLYEMLTGRPPFSGAELNAILYQVLNTAPPLPTSINASLPPGFDRIVARAMAKEPDKRYPDAGQIAADLRQVHSIPGLMQKPADDLPVFATAGKPVAAEPAGEIAKSKRTRLGVYIAIPVIVVALITGWLLRSPAPGASAPQNTTERPFAETPRAVASGADKPAQQGREIQTAGSTVETGKLDEKADEAGKPRKTRSEKAVTKAVARTKETASTDRESKAASSGDWHFALQADIRACDRESFFPRILCVDKARRRYCPGHWDNVPECAAQTNRR